MEMQKTCQQRGKNVLYRTIVRVAKENFNEQFVKHFSDHAIKPGSLDDWKPDGERGRKNSPRSTRAGLYKRAGRRRVALPTNFFTKKPHNTSKNRRESKEMERTYNHQKTVSGKHIRILFDESMKEWLFKESERRGIGVSQLVRDSVRAEQERSK